MSTYGHPLPWTARASCVSDAGQVRQQNEDRCLVALEQNLFIVSDGIGGQQAGGIAAQAVVTVLPRMIEQHMAQASPPTTGALEGVLRDTILELNHRLLRESMGRAGLQGMGATLVLAWLRGPVAHLAHMGDSRIYLYRQGSLTQLTEDHSVVALLLRRGEITPQEARMHPARGRLSRYIGMAEDVYPTIQTVHLQEGDRLLLCSDGLTGLVPDAQIAGLLQSNSESEAACRALVSAANAAGGTDNITTLLVDCGKIG